MEEARCPNCSALVTADADWCGQCFSSLAREGTDGLDVDVPPAPAAVVARSEEGGRAEATWPCPTCGSSNPIEMDLCRVCGTSFAALLRGQEEPPDVSPRDAFLWSLTFPGVGHAKLGRAGDGIARGTLFALTFGLTLVIVLSGVTNGPVFAVVVLLLVSALALYLGSAAEAYRIAQGGAQFVTARVLLWATVALIMVSVALLALSVVTVSGR